MSWEQSVRESLGQLDTHKLDTVLGLKIHYSYDCVAKKLTGSAEFKVTYATAHEADRVVVICVDVFRRMRLPEISGDILQFHELEIHNASRDQLEDVNYQLRDYRSDFECDCKDVHVTCLCEYANNRIGDVIWGKEGHKTEKGDSHESW